MRAESGPFSKCRAAAVASILLVASGVSAQDNTAQARAAYDRGAAAYDARDYATAAPELARADELQPNGTVLELALQAATRAPNAPLVMELAARVEERVPSSTPLYARAREARQKFSASVGKIVVRCPPPSVFCKAVLDGHNIAIDVPKWAATGEHALDLDADGIGEHQSLVLQSQQTLEVKPTPPAAKPAASASVVAPPPSASIAPLPSSSAAPPPPIDTTPRNARNGISPVWFYVAAASTLVAGGVTAWSAVDTKNAHDAFEKSPSTKLQTDGRSAQDRTNVLIAVTAGLGALTVATGVFFVGWSSGPTAAYGGRF